MSRHKPHSLLSFIYNTTIDPPYRLEMHSDMETSFERFGVKTSSTKTSCYEVEQAAYWLRNSSNDVEASGKVNGNENENGKQQMGASAKVLFGDLAVELGPRIAQSKNGSILGTPLSLALALDPRAPANGPAEAPWSPMGVTKDGDVAVKTGGLLLEYFYFFCHFPAARKTIVANMQVLTAAFGNPTAVASALKDLDVALDNPAASAGLIQPAVDVVCEELAVEYETQGWPRCW